MAERASISGLPPPPPRDANANANASANASAARREAFTDKRTRQRRVIAARSNRTP